MFWNPDLYQQLIRFAAEAHAGQRVPGSELPYLVHLANVVQETLRACAADATLDADLALACAWLHDTVEDTEVTLDQVREHFGPAAAAGVAALTKDEALPKAERMADSLDRLRAQPREVWVVKLADRITNLQPPPAHWPVAKRRAYRDEARVILERLGEGSRVLSERLGKKIEDYAAYL